jgi:2-keto-4-pentenoate hydratase/2-oxohepta-3-ene-1,7-dioic acid hydratase in catechol pathway
MPTRRQLIASAGLASIATVAAGSASAQDATPPVAKPYDGPHTMPRGVTLLAIRQTDGSETLGVKTPNGVLDVVKAMSLLDMEAPASLEELLVLGNATALDALIKASAKPEAKPAFLDEAKITFGRLFIDPTKIICVGLNYKAHLAEAGAQATKEPILFNKYNNTLAAHQCTIKLPPKEVSTKFDYETELLIVIGKEARNVSEADALNYVAGYCVGQDFSARDLQLETGGQWMVGKTLDGFAPIGPYFVSADQVDPNNLHITTRVNGETRQDSNTSLFIFNPQRVVSYASKLFTLNPGDIIFTGTPSGVIVGMPKDKQVWLKAGDRIESEIEKLGVLKFDLA